MSTILYNLHEREAYCLLVTGIDVNLKGVKQRFSVVNGVWDAYWCDGVVTYPESDWRYGTSREMLIYSGELIGKDYNEIIYNFEKNILGLY